MAFITSYYSKSGLLQGACELPIINYFSSFDISTYYVGVGISILQQGQSIEFTEIPVTGSFQQLCYFNNNAYMRIIGENNTTSIEVYRSNLRIYYTVMGTFINKIKLVTFSRLGKKYCGIAYDTLNRSVADSFSFIVFDVDIFNIKEETMSDEYGEESSEGGYSGGTFDDTSDTISLPNVPTIGYISSGGGAYKLSSGELNSLVNEIFVDYTPIESGDTGLEKIGIMLENVALTLQQLLNSQFVQYVTDVHVVPVAPTTGSRTNIKLGSRSMQTTSTPITSDIVVVDCGTLNISEYYSNFIDYVGTVCKLYLPFVGFVDVKNEWFQSGSLNVTYHFNVIDGSFMAFLKATSSKSNLSNTVVASYGGSCCVHLPFVGSDYSNVLSGLVSTVNGASSIVGSGDIGGAVSSATQMLNNLSGNVNGSNNYNSNSAFLGIRTPYLYIERVVSSFSETYDKEKGLPLNVSYTLNDVSGYTEIDEIHLDGVNCTEEEKNELLQLLQNGVIV